MRGKRATGTSIAAGVALAFALAQAPASSSTPTFTSTTVATERFTGQPAVAVDRSITPNPIYVAATDYSVWNCCTFFRPLLRPTGQSALVWRSLDGGATFQGPVRTSFGDEGGGESDIAVDGNGWVYVVETFGVVGHDSLPVMVSENRGESFGFLALANLRYAPFTNCYIRPWIAAQGKVNPSVVVTAQCGDAYRAFVQLPGAFPPHFEGPFTIATDVFYGGKPAFSPLDGNRVYVPYTTPGGDVRVARSTDGGKTWTSIQVATIVGKSVNYPAVAVAPGISSTDEVYLVWAEEPLETSPAAVRFAAGLVDGQNWSTPVTISDPLRSSLFPSVGAGASGKVDIAYYAATNPAGPDPGADLGHALTSWDVEMAQSLNANLSIRTFTRMVAVSGFHTGSVCTIGGGPWCVNRWVEYPNGPVPLDGTVGEFFRLDHDSAGNATFAYPKDRSITQNHWSAIDLMLGRQTGGTTIR